MIELVIHGERKHGGEDVSLLASGLAKVDSVYLITDVGWLCSGVSTYGVRDGDPSPAWYGGPSNSFDPFAAGDQVVEREVQL